MRSTIASAFLLAASAVIWITGDASAGEGHDAGAEWADENGIEDPDDCDGNSWSFIEGCRERAIENCVEQCYYEDDEEICEEECES